MISKWLKTACVALLVQLLWMGAAQAATLVISGSLSAGSPTYDRITDRAGFPDSANDALPYALIEIKTGSIGGTVTIAADNTTVFDSFLTLYSAFSRGNPSANRLFADDDSNGYPHAKLTATGLAANTSYWLVVTSYSSAANAVFPLYGNYSITMVGDVVSIPPKLSQSITWGATPSVIVGGTGTLSATASSGLPVTFSAVPGNGKCTVFGSTVTGVAVGLCSVYADQAGNATYEPAPAGFMSFSIAPAPISPPSAPTNVSVSSGPGRATVTFSAPASTGGAPIVSYTATCAASGQTTRTATGPGSPLIVDGLSGGVVYACSVTANNGTYTGTASADSTVTPGGVFDLTPILLLLLD